MKKKRKTKVNHRKLSVKRLIQKCTWFSLLAFVIFMLGIMIGGSIVGLTWESDGTLTRNSFIMLAWLDAFILVGLMLLFNFLLRKKQHTPIRWTRRSFIALSVLVGITTVVTSILILASFDNESFLAEESQTLAESNAVAGNGDYFEGLTFDNAKLLEATNRERVGSGVSPLTMSDNLTSSALKKCEDMVAKNYWSHNDPEGNEPWHFFTEAGYNYETARENLAHGYIVETDVVVGWMNSPSHKENLLSNTVTEVGFGTCKSENYVGLGKQLVVVQHLGKAQKAVQQTTKPSTPSSQQSSGANCSNLFSTYYTIPMIGVGSKPTSTYLIYYIGTDDYEFEVAKYNTEVAIYNSKWQQHKSNFLNQANRSKCDASLYTSMMDIDEARPYPSQ